MAGLVNKGGLCAWCALEHFKLNGIVHKCLHVFRGINPFNSATEKVKNDFHSLPLMLKGGALAPLTLT
jgi:hypothetical protein